jgi:hypothetical protein
MHDEPNGRQGKWDVMEREAVYLLTDPTRYPARSGACRTSAVSWTSTTRRRWFRPLRNAGLLHQTAGGFVFATPAAFRTVTMVGRII